jgi:hypothetical protein
VEIDEAGWKYKLPAVAWRVLREGNLGSIPLPCPTKLRKFERSFEPAPGEVAFSPQRRIRSEEFSRRW